MSDAFSFGFSHNGHMAGKPYTHVLEILKKTINENKLKIEVIEMPWKELEDRNKIIKAQAEMLDKMEGAFNEIECMALGGLDMSTKKFMEMVTKVAFRKARQALALLREYREKQNVARE